MWLMHEVRAALEEARDTVASYFATLPVRELYRRAADDEWAPIDDLRHLNRTVTLTTSGLRLPRPVMRVRFGRARRPSDRYEEVRERYLGRLSAGIRSPNRLAPPVAVFDDAEAYRRRTLDRWADVCAALDAAAARWKERDADRYVLPHPALGPLTVREILFFTHVHDLHHVDVARRRVRRSGGGSGVLPLGEDQERTGG
mgnify:CR=1 FL=1